VGSITEREVERVRTQARAGLLMSMESPWGQAHYLARQLSVYGRLVEPAEVLAELRAVTLDAGPRRRREDARRPPRPRHHRLPGRPRRMTLATLVGEPWGDYGLMDSGHGRKLERYGPYSFIRPEPQAMWAPALAEWDADGEFVPGSDEEGGGRWLFHRPVPKDGWDMAWQEVRFRSQCTPFRHLAFFPDMAPQWAWMRERLKPGAEAMNLFGYTGVGTLAMAAAGARLTHVDASKKSVEAGKQNAALSGMADRPIRWMIDDAAKFTAREVRRGRRYDGIILDPPKYGRGPTGEVWKLEEGLPDLIADCRRLLDWRQPLPRSHRLRGPHVGAGHRRTAQPGARRPRRRVDCGDMAVREEARGLLLPTAIFARWSRD
jgi:23S rRNA (cytosine1962-C5)-methyltransferase